MATPSSDTDVPASNAAPVTAPSSPPKSSAVKTNEENLPIIAPGHSRPVVDVRYNRVKSETELKNNNIFIVSACHDKMPMLRWADNGDWIGTFQGHKGAVWSASLNSNATMAATGSADFSAKLWNSINGEVIQTYDHNHIVKSVDFSMDDCKLLTGGHDKKLRYFDINDYNKAPQIIDTKTVIRDSLWLDENLAVCGLSDGYIKSYDFRSNDLVHEVKVNDTEIKDMEINFKLNILTVASGKKISFYNLKDFTLIKDYVFDRVLVECASLSPDGSRFITGGSDLWVHVVDYHKLKEVSLHKGHHGPLFCIRYSPDGKSYASGSEDGTIRIWQSVWDKIESAEE